MQSLLKELKSTFKGDVTTDATTMQHYSHDASIYELVPDAVLAPKNALDIRYLVQFVSENKRQYPSLAITPRGAGTCMSGAAIGSSLLLDMTKYFNRPPVVTRSEIHAQPGVFMRDIDPLTDAKGVMLGCVPASRALITVGGMVGNNSGGEQSLRYGNAENFVKELSVVFADGNEYVVKPLTRAQLAIKMKQDDFEGNLYKKTFGLIERNYDEIKNARPKVNKNSMGYNLWSVWDRETGIFDMTRLITGSQGTLGIITDIKMHVVPKATHSGLLIVYLPGVKQLGKIIKTVMAHRPATFEGFDDITFDLGMKHFKTFKNQLGTKEWLKTQAHLLGTAQFRSHLPSMVLMIEFDGVTQVEVDSKLQEMQSALMQFKVKMKIEGDEKTSAKFWQIRRASLMLLRQKAHDKYAAPFMDDMAVQPKFLPEFLPKVRKIIKKYELPATIAGHYGDGNFHIIPLMSITSKADQAKLEPTMRELIPLVLQYGGTMAGEHNDGMVRGPWLPAMFGDRMFMHFKTIKELFDPTRIFNPHVKVDAEWEFSMEHIRTNNNQELIK